MDDRVNGDGAADEIESGDEPAGADDEATGDGSASLAGAARDGARRENGDRPGPRNRTGGRTDGAASSIGEGATGIRSEAVPDPDVGGSVRPYLRSGERLDVHVRGRLLGEPLRGEGVVGVTGGRLLAVTDDGEFAGAGLDRVCSVRSYPRTAVDVRGVDYRLLLAVGYLFAVVGFVGVLGAASNPLAPVFALATLGGAMAVDFVRREEAALDLAELAAEAERSGLPDGVSRGLRGLDRRVDGLATDHQLALAGAGALAAVPFLGIVAVDASLLTSVFALLTVGSVVLIVYGFRNADDLDGFDLVQRRERTVSVGLADGTTVHVRTAPDAGLDQVLAGRVHTGDPESAPA